ncbi:hypothetical protein LQK80_01225 [Bacillus thuringiensis]|nr:hypothetical protein [Bacillus thuringiensis]MCE0553240.1 hypothetical protein [Bacillus thuringiensis]
MHNVLKSSLLDVTIDKLSIVADFKEGIKKKSLYGWWRVQICRIRYRRIVRGILVMKKF